MMMHDLGTIAAALSWARDELRAALVGQSQSPQAVMATIDVALDAECLLAFVCQITRSHIWAHPDKPISLAQQQQFQQVVALRATDYPLAYIIGACEFWSLSLQVTQAVLIPRPDTERVVETVCALFPDKTQSLDCVDCGTGSGAIALAIAVERPLWRMTALDQSREALAVAKLNAKINACTRIDFVYSDWLQAVSRQRFHCIVANPPYLASDDPYLRGAIRYEPSQALIADAEGLGAYHAIISQARACLHPNGKIVLEHGLGQEKLIANILKKQGFLEIHHYPDLQGILRVISAKMV